MRDEFFSKTVCDRCHGSLKDGRMQSMYNQDCLCMNCIEKERQRPDYKAARDADIEQIKQGNYNFEGIGLDNESDDSSCENLDPVTTICYGELQVWAHRADAIKFFLNAMAMSEGSERERYTKIHIALLLGSDICTDEDD